MLTAEFRRRLKRLEWSVHFALENDSADGSLLPSLFHVFTYLWCNSNYEKFKK